MAPKTNRRRKIGKSKRKHPNGGNKTRRGGGMYDYHPLGTEIKKIKQLLHEENTGCYKWSFWKSNTDRLNNFYQNGPKRPSFHKKVFKDPADSLYHLLIRYGVNKSTCFVHRNGPFSKLLDAWKDRNINALVSTFLSKQADAPKMFAVTRTKNKFMEIWTKKLLLKTLSIDEETFYDQMIRNVEGLGEAVSEYECKLMIKTPEPSNRQKITMFNYHRQWKLINLQITEEMKIFLKHCRI
jgi:hypothetical protein